MRIALIGVAMAAAFALSAQPTARPAFDVASLKHVGDTQSNAVQVGPGSFLSNMRPFRFTPGTVSCRTTLMTFLTEAYDLKTWQIQGPEWLGAEVYELAANMPEGASRETARLMLQTMLAERMGLKLRRDQKEFSV